jgi:ketosteroid isomerase-like protein
MSENKKTVERYLDGFRTSDHAQILSCLTDDVIWEMPGAFHLVGKAAFDKEIENEAFVGRPTITTSRMIEEDDVVIAEGAVRAKRVDGGLLSAVFCDVFEMKDARITRLTTYLTVLK